MKGLVSILIPCYNAEMYLDKCLTAILNQTYKKIELIIVNDGSTDNSEKIIDKYVKKFKIKGLKLIKLNQTNQGQAAACSNGLKYVTGEYLYWQDADDTLNLYAIEDMVNFLHKNTDFDLVRGNVLYRKEDDYKNNIGIGKPINPSKINIFKEYLFEKGSYCFSGIFMVRMSYFDRCNPGRDLYVSSGGQNFQLLLPILYNGRCGYINEIVYNYSVRDDSHSHVVKSKKDKLERCKVHQKTVIKTLDTIDQIPKREKKILKLRVKIKYFKRKIIIIIPTWVLKLIKRVKSWKR